MSAVRLDNSYEGRYLGLMSVQIPDKHSNRQLSSQLLWLFELACEYDRIGDVYHAVKLCKRLIKQVPSWVKPYSLLAEIYLRRREWKPALHYSLEVVKRQANDERAREITVMAAMAQRRWELARRMAGARHVQHSRGSFQLVCLNPGVKPEVLLARSRSVGQSVVQGVPQPSSGYRFGDVVLTGWSPIAWQVVAHRRVEVYPVWKRLIPSRYTTYSVVLTTASSEALEAMRQLCRYEGIGFDNWSRAIRQMAPLDGTRPAELYDFSVFPQSMPHGHTLIALASTRKGRVWRLLHNWHVITGEDYYNLVKHD